MTNIIVNKTIAASLIISGVLLLWALATIIRLFIELWQLRRETDVLSDDLTVASLTEGGRLRDIASDIVLRLRTAAQNRTALLVFDPDRKIARLWSVVASSIAFTRALAGILILAGLLATLWNLRGAVDELHKAFSDIKEYSIRVQQHEAHKDTPTTHQSELPLRSASGTAPSDTNPTIDRSKLPGGMAAVAASSSVAFFSSFVAISCAAFILLLTSIVQWYAGGCLHKFSDWVHRRFEASVAESSGGDQAEAAARLANAVDQFAQAASGFDNLASEMQHLSAFGDKFDQAATAIQESVGQLPAQVHTSFQGLSAEVANGIASELRHVIEQIGRIYAIYGEQELRLKKINEFMGQLVESTADMTRSLGVLRPIPVELHALTETISGTSHSVTKLSSTVEALDTKVAALPAESFREAVEIMRSISQQIDPLEVKLEQSISSLQTLVSSWRSELGDLIASNVRQLADNQMVALGEFRQMLQAGHLPEAYSAIAGLEQNAAAMSQTMHRMLEHTASVVTSAQERKNVQQVTAEIVIHLQSIEALCRRNLLQVWLGRDARSEKAGR